MQRRSFLSLLLATPLLPVLAKIEPIVAAPAAVPLRVVDPARVRAYMTCLGFPQAVVEPGRVAIVEAIPMAAFRPRRIMCNAIGQFEILNVSSKGEPQLDCAVPAEFFATGAFGMNLQFATADAGDRIVLAVHNVGNTIGTVNFAMMGTCVRELSDAELAAEAERSRLDRERFEREERLKRFGRHAHPALRSAAKIFGRV